MWFNDKTKNITKYLKNTIIVTLKIHLKDNTTQTEVNKSWTYKAIN